ncbi:tyrosine-type recombinase/integrase [Salana multivorans]
MSALAGHAADYLRLRRHLGFALTEHERLLRQFTAHLAGAGWETITVETAVAWAGSPSKGTVTEPVLRAARRLTAVRGFAEYLHAINPAHEVPPRGVFAAARRRREPFIYDSAQVVALLHAAQSLPGNGRGRTWVTVFGLLAATGMRSGEALALRQSDTDLPGGVLTIAWGKNNRPRLVPLHPGTVEALDDYARWRDRERPAPPGAEATFFTSAGGGKLSYSAAREAFVRASSAAGLREGNTPPRLHDLRHTFAVTTLLDWHRSGADVAAMLPVLSTYLGHANPVDTYWYLSAIPELMSHAAGRLAAGRTRR